MFEDLFRDGEDYPPSEYTQTTRRPFLLLAGGLGGIAVLTTICLAVYAFVLIPRSNSRGATETAQASIQNAIAAALTQSTETPVPPATLAPSSPTPTPPQPDTPTTAPTSTPAPSATALPFDTPTAQPTSPPTVLPQIVLSDPLGGPGSGWTVTAQENFEINYRDGGYRMFVNIAFADIWSIRDLVHADLILEVDTRKLAGPDDGYYGVICRFQDSANYYGFTIENSGAFRIFKLVGGEATVLGESGQTDLISPGETNRVRGDCIGDILTLYVNGEQLLQTRDEAFSTGKIGMVAGTRQASGLEVIFDNFVLATP